MVDQFTLQTLGVMIAAASVVIGVVTWMFQSREARRINPARLFMQIYDRFNDPEFARAHSAVLQWEFEDYGDWDSRYGPRNNIDANSAWLSVARFFHGVGVLVDRGLVDIGLVDELMGDPARDAWEKMGVITLAVREHYNRPRHGEVFENLYKELKKHK